MGKGICGAKHSGDPVINGTKLSNNPASLAEKSKSAG